MPVQIDIPKEQIDGFARVWTYKGLAINLDDAHKQFAVDFAKLLLASFIEGQLHAQQAAQAAQANKIQLT